MQNKRTYFLFIIIVVIALLLVSINADKKIKEVEKSDYTITGKFVSIERYPRSRDYFFEFFYRNQRKRCRVGEVPEGFYKNIGKFYRIKYLEKYPDLIIVKFDEEVIDTTEIVKAGFSTEDL